ncbi:hypothetical protein [Stenotrophomonas sp. FSL W7-1447]
MRLFTSGGTTGPEVSQGEAWQRIHRLFQPQPMQLVFRAVAEALG